MYICTYLIALLIPVSPRCEEALDCVAGSFAFRRSWMPRWSYYRVVVTNKPEGSSCTGYVRRRRQFRRRLRAYTMQFRVWVQRSKRRFSGNRVLLFRRSDQGFRLVRKSETALKGQVGWNKPRPDGPHHTMARQRRRPFWGSPLTLRTWK